MTAGRVRTVGHSVMAVIAGYGVDTVFGIPGTHNLELYRPLPDLGFRVVTTRHEQGAVFAADGWAQRAGRPGVVLTTSGPGLLNALSAAANAYAESRPILIVSPGPSRRDAGAQRGGLHETKDQSAAAGAVLRWSRRATTEQEAIDAVHDAFAEFATTRPQPVHLEVALDVLESAAAADATALAPRSAHPPRVPALRINEAVALLAAAQRPVIIAGGGATGATSELAEVAERLGAPVVTTINGKAALAESHPLSLGSELRLAATAAHVSRADALLVVGSKRSEAELWDNVVSPHGPTVRIDLDAAALRRDGGLAIRLLGDAAATLGAIAAELPGRQAPVPDLSAVRAEQAAEAERLAPRLMDLAQSLAAGLPGDAVVTGDSSQIVYHALTSVLRQEAPCSFLYMATFATLGYALPAAIGARLASDTRPVVCVAGDGALMVSIQELVTACELDLDLTVVCIDNGGYGEIRQNQVDRGIAPLGVELRQPDWPALARAMGATGRTVAADELVDAIPHAIAARGVHLLHVPVV